MNEIQTQLIGRVASLPEQVGQNGSYKFSVALDFKKDPETKETTPIFISILVFTATAERYKKIISLLTKGSKIFISGTILDLNAYVSKDGEPKAQMSISLSTMSFVSNGNSKNSEGNGDINNGNNYNKGNSARSFSAKRTFVNRRPSGF